MEKVGTYSIPAEASRLCALVDFEVIGPQDCSCGGAGESACRGGFRPRASRDLASVRSARGDQKPDGSKKPTDPGFITVLKVG